MPPAKFRSDYTDFPTVEIVISSTWRYQFALDELRARFSPDIAVRIIGATQKTEYIEGEFLPARREGEILGWLTATGREGTPWIAIDDALCQFQKHRDKLVACSWYIGMDDATESELRAALARRQKIDNTILR